VRRIAALFVFIVLP